MCVYMMTNFKNSVIYVGVTNDLIRRVYEHKNGMGSRFTNKYRVHKLVYCEEFRGAMLAIEREKQINAGSRKKKLELILSMNPKYKDLYEELMG